MSTSPHPMATDSEPAWTQPQAFVLRRCLAATCDGCHGGFPDDEAIAHYDTRTDLLAAIKENDWTLGSDGLHCPRCSALYELDDTAQVDVAVIAQAPAWLTEVCCTLISCTQCHFHLEDDQGEAHFPSMLAAAAAAVSRGWVFAAHQVWCLPCAARVGAAHTPSPVSGTA